ncbi:hypothetical protein [Reichenbachiella sp.]|uniref:hypothetical protein n=1 Tax=Reichenbachiella sp. TaxID=2184521 RepID=UPI003BB0D64D
MKKIYSIAIALIIYVQGIAQEQKVGEIDCRFVSGANVVAKDKKSFTFIGENCDCNKLSVFHANAIDKIEVGSDCKVDISPWLGGVKKMTLTVKSEGGESERKLNVLTSKASITADSDSNPNPNQEDDAPANPQVNDNIEPPHDYGKNILPKEYLELDGTNCLNTHHTGRESKVIEYNVCCNRFYYNYYPGMNFFPLKGKNFKSKSGNKRGISKQDIYQKGTRVFVNDPLVFKLSTINYRNYLTTVTRNYASESEELPAFFEKALSPDAIKLENSSGCELSIQLWLYNKTGQLTSYYEGLPDCMTVDQFNKWNKEIKEKLDESFKEVCPKCDTKNLGIVSCLQATFKEKFSGPEDKEKSEEGNQIKEFLTLYYALDKKSHDLQYNVPQVKNYDEIEFSLNILPKDSSAGIYLSDEKVSIPIFGGFKIDGSSGLFYSSLTDHIFSTVQDSVRSIAPDGSISYQSGNRIVRQNTSTGDPGLAGLVHFYSRWGKSLNLAFSLGAGFTFKDNPQARYLVGGSVLIGRKERIALSYGAAFGQVTRLKGEFEDPNIYQDVTNITTKRFDTGYFFSLSYNIPFRKKSQKVAPTSSAPPPTTPAAVTTDDAGDNESDGNGDEGGDGEESEEEESEEEESEGEGGGEEEEEENDGEKGKEKNKKK